MPMPTSLLVVTVCGFLYGLCFAPARLHVLAWVVLVPALVAIRRANRRQAVMLAAALASAGTIATVDWLPRTVTTFFHQSWSVGVALLAGVTLVMVVPPYIFSALCYRRLARSGRWWLPLGAAAAWVVGEYARAHLWTGNPWVLFGYSQAGVVPVMQVADLASVYGISFTLVTVNVALAELWLSWRQDGWPARGALGGCTAAAVLIGLVLAYGQWRLRQETKATPAPVTVAVVQGNLELGSQWRQEFYGKNLDVYLRLTGEALRQHHARLVVWPETAMTFFLEREPLYQVSIASFLQPWSAQLLAGGANVVEAAGTRYYNSAYAIDSQGHILGRYDKQRLLPFSEYFPLPQFDFLRRDFGRVREFTPGGSAPPLPTAAGAAGVLICNEAFFPEVARARVLDGAGYLVNLTNDTWVGDPKFSLIAFDMSVLRAVEQRRTLVRASTAGPSAIIDPFGRILAQTPLFATTQCAGPVRASTQRTVYARIGDAFVGACALLVGAALLAGERARRGDVGVS